MKTFLVPLSAVTAFLFVSSPVSAQFGGSLGVWNDGRGTVSGSAVVSIERDPAIMRMEVDLLSKAATLKEALAGLKDRIEAARAQLIVLGADRDSIEIGSPRLSTVTTDQQRQMEVMLAQRLRSGGGPKPKSKSSTPVTVAVKLTADWSLKAKTAEELLLETHPLQKKIKEADIAGAKEAGELSPEQQEILEELEGSGYLNYGTSGEAQPGEPVFYFVSRIPDEQLDETLAEGFQKARAKAARLAKAAGAELGKLASLTVYDTDQYSDYSQYNFSYESPLYQSMQVAERRRQESTGEAIAVGVQPGKVTYKVTVMASFDLKGE